MLQTGFLGQFSQVKFNPDPEADPDQSQEHVGLRTMEINTEDAG